MSFSSTLLALLDANSAYYKMTEASGTTMSDSSGNGRDGTYSGTYTLGQTGLISGETDTSVLFGGGFASVGHASWMDQATRGVGCLFTHSSTSATRYLCGRFTSGTNQYLSIDLTSGGTLRCYAFISGTQRLISAVAPSINNGATHMVFACYDGTTLSLYYDGSLLTSGTWSGTLSATSTAVFLVGVRGDSTETWDDHIEKSWYGPVLTSTQVANLWAQASGSATVITGAASLTESTSVTVSGRKTAIAAAAPTEATSATIGGRVTARAAVTASESTEVDVTAGATLEAAASPTEASSVTVGAVPSRVAAVSIAELTSLAVAAALDQMAAVAIVEDASVAVSTASDLAVLIVEATSVFAVVPIIGTNPGIAGKRRRTGVGYVTIVVPVQDPPAKVRMQPVRSVVETHPTPTLVDGIPS